MTSFVVGQNESGHDLVVTVPVPPGWVAGHDAGCRLVEVSLPGSKNKVTFTYNLYVAKNGGVFLKDNTLVQGKGYGRRVKASTALEFLATLRGPFIK